MVPIEFDKVYRRLDSTKRFLEGSSFNLNPTVELIDNDPQYDSEGEDAVYLPKKVDVYISNKNSKPVDSSEMTFSDSITTGSGEVGNNRINEVHQMNGASSWILFKKQVPSDDIEGYTLDFFIRNSDTYNNIEERELNL